MKFRLDAQHYMNDRLLEVGHIIGDETDVGLPDGWVPSRQMTPLDDEAKAFFSRTFPGATYPERDPTKAIPLRGTGDSARAPPLVPPKPVDPALRVATPQAEQEAVLAAQRKAQEDAAKAAQPKPTEKK